MPDPDTVTFYYPGMHEVSEDGTIIMRATGHEDGWRWTGVRNFAPDSTDYGFWQWVVAQRARWEGARFISSLELTSLRQEYDSRPD